MENKKVKLYATFIFTVVLVAVIVGVSVHYGTKPSKDGSSGQVKVPPTKTPGPKPTPSKAPNAAEKYSKAAVAADAEICSKVGRDILKQKGSAVDSLIATLICVGTVNFQSTGIGGGGFMVVYNRKYKKAEAFDYRETGPANMTEDIYNGDTTAAKVGRVTI